MLHKLDLNIKFLFGILPVIFIDVSKVAIFEILPIKMFP